MAHFVPSHSTCDRLFFFPSFSFAGACHIWLARHSTFTAISGVLSGKTSAIQKSVKSIQKKKSASHRRVLLTCTILAKPEEDGVLSVAWGSCELGYRAAIVTSRSSSVGSPTHPPNTHSLYNQHRGNVLHVYLKTATHTMTGCLHCEISSCLTDGCTRAHVLWKKHTHTHTHTQRMHAFLLIAIIIFHYVQKITMACESNRGDRWRPLWA